MRPVSPTGASSELVEYAWAASIASTISSGSTSRWLANSGTEGALPRDPVSVEIAWFNFSAVSWRRRGTRTDHPVPEMALQLADDRRRGVGREPDPARGSNRSMALTSPIEATCVRSSRLHPAGEPSSQVVRQGHEAFGQRVPGLRIRHLGEPRLDLPIAVVSWVAANRSGTRHRWLVAIPITIVIVERPSITDAVASSVSPRMMVHERSIRPIPDPCPLLRVHGHAHPKRGRLQRDVHGEGAGLGAARRADDCRLPPRRSARRPPRRSTSRCAPPRSPRPCGRSRSKARRPEPSRWSHAGSSVTRISSSTSISRSEPLSTMGGRYSRSRVNSISTRRHSSNEPSLT